MDNFGITLDIKEKNIKLKEDIKDFHKIYNNVIPAFKDKAHQKRKEN